MIRLNGASWLVSGSAVVEQHGGACWALGRARIMQRGGEYGSAAPVQAAALALAAANLRYKSQQFAA